MVLFAIVGELGSGKTLGLTYLAWLNHVNKQKALFSNYNLYGMPFTKVNSLPSLDEMKEGFFAGDELWLWLDARCTKSEKQRLIGSILLKSRKRDITIAYTTQSIHQIEKRIRDITDFTAYPIMSADNSYCRMEIFRGRPSPANRMKTPLYFMCKPIYALYNTFEEIRELTDEKGMEKPKLIPINQNIAWIKYLNSRGITDPKKIALESKRAEEIIFRRPEKTSNI